MSSILKKAKSLPLITLLAVLAACGNDEPEGTWDGDDYNTGKDTVMEGQTYHRSSMGYWYFLSAGNIMRRYNNGFSETLPANMHRNGFHLNSDMHRANGGLHTSGFGSTSRARGSRSFS
jgi:hypothetical protein